MISLILTPFSLSANSNLAQKLSGRILLQIKKNGEAWYVNPDNLQRYYMGSPNNAFELMSNLGLGITNNDFNNINLKKLSGKILIKVEDLGKAYYINPIDLSLHYLGSPQNAFELMRNLGLGITNTNLEKITKYDPNKKWTLINQAVPFTPQAPNAEWEIDIFQDGCEEASMIMALAWVNNETLNPQIAKEKIKAISEYEVEYLGGYHDASAYDISRLIKEYYKYNNILYKENVTINQIIEELKNGNVIIAPMNGQKLKNIHFTPPGSINHMLVITGYDESRHEFITNDPGTKRGEGYRYSEKIIFNSLRDYPTGYHEPNLKINKNIIVIKPK